MSSDLSNVREALELNGKIGECESKISSLKEPTPIFISILFFIGYFIYFYFVFKSLGDEVNFSKRPFGASINFVGNLILYSIPYGIGCGIITFLVSKFKRSLRPEEEKRNINGKLNALREEKNTYKKRLSSLGNVATFDMKTLRTFEIYLRNGEASTISECQYILQKEQLEKQKLENSNTNTNEPGVLDALSDMFGEMAEKEANEKMRKDIERIRQIKEHEYNERMRNW